MSLPEKGRASDCLAAEQSALCGPVYSGLVAKYGHISRISIKDVQVFSAVKTCWRREWERNSRLNSSGRTNIFVAHLLAVCWYTQRAQATVLPDDFCVALAPVY